MVVLAWKCTECLPSQAMISSHIAEYELDVIGADDIELHNLYYNHSVLIHFFSRSICTSETSLSVQSDVSLCARSQFSLQWTQKQLWALSASRIRAEWRNGDTQKNELPICRTKDVTTNGKQQYFSRKINPHRLGPSTYDFVVVVGERERISFVSKTKIKFWSACSMTWSWSTRPLFAYLALSSMFQSIVCANMDYIYM